MAGCKRRSRSDAEPSSPPSGRQQAWLKLGLQRPGAGYSNGLGLHAIPDHCLHRGNAETVHGHRSSPHHVHFFASNATYPLCLMPGSSRI